MTPYFRVFLVTFLATLALLAGVDAARAATFVGFSHTSPSAKDVALRAINDSKSTLLIAAYQYTSADILKAVIAAHKRGVRTAVILDRTQENGEGQAGLVASGIECYVDHTYRIMHHKTMVVDSMNVLNGSFNYTLSADKANAENALYTTGDAVLASRYTDEWNRLRALPKTAPCKGGAQ